MTDQSSVGTETGHKHKFWRIFRAKIQSVTKWNILKLKPDKDNNSGKITNETTGDCA